MADDDDGNVDSVFCSVTSGTSRSLSHSRKGKAMKSEPLRFADLPRKIVVLHCSLIGLRILLIVPIAWLLFNAVTK